MWVIICEVLFVCQLNSYLVKEKLPQETANLQRELNIMQAIAAEQHPTRSDLVSVQDKVNIRIIANFNKLFTTWLILAEILTD